MLRIISLALMLAAHTSHPVELSLPNLLQYIYRPQRSWGKVIFSQACVILFTGGCMLGCPPGADTPPGVDTPPGSRHPSWSRHPPGADTPPREQTPPSTEHAGRYGQHTGGMHPTGMQTCSHYCKLWVKCLQIHIIFCTSPVFTANVK